MNRTKFLSSVLVAAVLATTSVFVSCKDYDDDIQNLQAQIDKAALKSEIEALQTQLATVSANAESAQKKAEEALTKANAAVTADQLAAVKAIAEQAGKDAATAIQKASDASNAAADAAAAARAAQDAADQAVAAAADGTKALEEIGKLGQTYVTTAALSEQLEALKKELEQGGEVSPGQVGNYKAAIDELYQAVTSVSLYTSATANYKYGAGTHGHYAVVFPYAYEKGTKFPLDEYKYMVDDQYVFTQDNRATLNYELMIRVSPTNAKLSAEMLSLINSQGVELDKELVSVEKIEPFDEEVMTRAASSASGLWTVTLKLKDGYDENDFRAQVEKDNRNIVFAIAVNNTSLGGDDRRVVSEYDVTVDAGEAIPAYAFDVNETEVAQIHNRYEFCEGDSTVTWDKTLKTYAPELNWRRSTSQNPTPAIAEAISEQNSGDRINGLNGYDNRQDEGLLPVVKDEEIIIEFPELPQFKAIRAFYVTLDTLFAAESRPSEINAWNSYEYENVGWRDTKGVWHAAKLQYGNKGSIKIKNINNVKGDIIGFRVYAANLDGTLYDPDGRSFYVKVGDPVETKTLETIEVVVTDNADDCVKDFEFEAGSLLSDEVNNYVLNWAGNNSMVLRGSRLVYPVEDKATAYEQQNGTQITSNSVTTNFVITFLNPKNGKYEDFSSILADDVVADVTTGRVQILNPNQLLDDNTYHLVLKGYATSTYSSTGITEPIDLIRIDVKKLLTDQLPDGLTKKQGQLPADILTVWMKPMNNLSSPWSVDWNVNNSDNVNYGKDVRPFDLADIFNNLQRSVVTSTGTVKTYFGFDFMRSDLLATKEIETKSAFDGTWGIVSSEAYGNKYNEIVSGSYGVPYANKEFVDGELHDVYATYEYRNISLTRTKTGGTADWTPVQEDYEVRGTAPLFKVQYISSLDLNRIVPWYAVVNSIDHRPDLYQEYGVSAADAIKLDNGTAAQKALAQHIREMHYAENFVVTYETGGNICLDSLRYDQIDIPGLSEATVASKTEIVRSQTETLGRMIDNNYLKVTSVDIVDANGNVCDYLETPEDFSGKVYVGGKMYVHLTPTRSTMAPALYDNMNYILRLTVVDVFGHERTVDVAFTMLKPVVI